MKPFDENRITYFGVTNARNKRIPFGIKAKDRSKHMYIIGKTGMGKSTMLENMIIQDIQNGEGLAFIDPHGASAEKVLDYVPEHRIKDVLYFAPYDVNKPIAFNVMEDVGYDKRHLVVSGLMGAFKKIWVDQWSSRMEHILGNTLLALLEYPDSTLLDVNKMYVNKVFRKKVTEHITDPLVKSFWQEEFATYTDTYTREATPAIQNKIGQFTSNPLIRNIVGQPHSSFDLRKVMDERKIFIADLSKGRIGETNADLLGSMLTTKLYLAAMSRAEEPAQTLAKLPDFYFYVDEFQSIANESFADILSEARKYKLNLTLAHQYIEQMEENVRNAVFGNVGTTIAFRVGPFDAETLETIFKPHFYADDLVNLGFTQIYLTLMIDGVGCTPFSATTLPPIESPAVSFKDQILMHSRETYGANRAEIEESIKGASETLSKETMEEHKRVSSTGQRSGGQSTGRGKEGRERTPLPRSFRESRERPARDISQDESRPPHQSQRKDAPEPVPLSSLQRNTQKFGEKKEQPKEDRDALRNALKEAMKDRAQLEQKEALTKETQKKNSQTNSAKKEEKPKEIPADVLNKILGSEKR